MRTVTFEPCIPNPGPKSLTGGMDPRDQARRLPPDRAARRRVRAAIDPQRARLELGSADRGSHVAQPELIVRDRWRGRAARRRRPADFNGLHSHMHDAEVQFYAFDILVSDGEDLRRLPLSMRKTNLARLLARRVDGSS